MADGQEEDFTQLPLPDRFAHKNWKVRKEGYEAAVREFSTTPDEADPIFRPFILDTGLWKAAAADSNVAAQQEGLAALCAFLKYGGKQAASRSRPETVQPLYEKGLSSTRPGAKANALEALLLYVEIDKPDLVIEELLQVLAHKQPKVLAGTLAAITAIFHSFGVKIVDSKPVLKNLPKVFGHADKNVRAEATNLTVELYRWLKEAMKPIFWGELKPVQQQDLEKLFEKVKEEPAPRQERFTTAQQAAMATSTVTPGDDVGDESIIREPEEEEPVEVDAFDLAEPVDVYSKIPEDFHDNTSSTKWKDRKDALDALFNILNTPRIKDGPFDDVIRVLAKCMKDANIAVVTVAANCVEKLAYGLRAGFSRYRSSIMSPMMERLKEKKQSVADALGAGLDAVFASTSLTDCLEETLGFLTNKNPQVKGETCKYLARCLRSTRDVPLKAEQKAIADAGIKLLTESTEAMRSGGAELLGTLMKIIGERAMGPYLDGLDDIRKTKIREYFDVAEVKAKEKPKPVAAPAKSAASFAAGKKVVVGGKKPAPKKATPSTTDESTQPAPRPVAKPLPKPAKPVSVYAQQPSASKLSAPKKPSGGATASPQRRVVSPPFGIGSEEDAVAPTPSKYGMGRGGLAGRSLSRPAVNAPMSPPPAAPVSNGLSAIERAELEELRAEKERLSAIADSLRSSNAKLTAEIAELQNQNAQLIEDHTRDVLQIKAKETQLVRARGECDVLRSEVDSTRKEGERYKREVSRLGRESLGRDRDGMMPPPVSRDAVPVKENGIYSDAIMNGHANGRPTSAAAALHRTGSGTSVSSKPGSGRPQQSQARPQNTYTSSSFSPSEEKENTGDGVFGNRRKISPSLGSGRGSPVRRTGASAAAEDGSSAGGSVRQEQGPAENWKRAAEVTSQLKARIEAMKARQGLNRPH